MQWQTRANGLEILRNNKFSILVGESTYIYWVKVIITLLVMYFCDDGSTAVTQLLKCTSHDAMSTTTEALSEA